MKTRFQLILDKMTANPNKLFLADGLGAFITAFSLGITLASFEAYFGMPVKTLYFLSSIACIYTIYSICCYFLLAGNWQPYLWGIAVANLMYCCLTTGMVLYFYPKLTVLGLAYFLLEILVVSALIIIELRVFSQLTDKNI